MKKISPETTILITGAAGGLGTATVACLKRNGFTNILTPSSSELNLLQPDAVLSYFQQNKPAVVIHLACIVYGLLGNIQNQMRSVLDNTQINSNLFRAINENPVEYIFFAGTVASYAYPYINIPLQEKDFFLGLPHEGEFGYAMSKRHAYSYLHILNQTKKTRYTYGIFTNLYGENDRFNDSTGHVIPSLIMKAYHAKLTNTPFTVWGDGSAQRDFLHFDDAANAIYCCMMTTENEPLLNISSGKAITIKELSETVAKAAGIDEIVYLTDKPVGIFSRVVDNSKLKKLGFEQLISMKDGIENVYKWYSKNIEDARQ